MNVDFAQEHRPFTAVEFCTGYAGIHLGLKRAIPSLRVIAFSEIEAFPVANLVAKMEAGLLDPAPVWTDLKTFPGLAFRNKVDLLVGGFPCQGFSAAGKRLGDQDPRHLWPYFVEQIGLMRPSYCFFENVDGIISSKLAGEGWSDPPGTPVLLHVLRELERLGYIATAGVFSAAEVGAPHQRKRVFILAVRSDVADSHVAGSQGWDGGELQERGSELSFGSGGASFWPSRPGEPQHCWEPPRTAGGELAHGHQQHDDRGRDAGEGRRSEDSDRREGEIESEVGRNFNESTYRLDHALLYESCDNRVDELRLLGNGVVPATAERAWRVLWSRFFGGVSQADA